MTFKNNFIYLSPEAFQEYQDLQEIIQRIQVGENEMDSWQYIWGSGTYTSKKYYNLPFKNIKQPSPFLWNRDSRCCHKLRTFTWLLLMDRLDTRNLLRKKNYNIEGNNYSCVLCNGSTEETAFHHRGNGIPSLLLTQLQQNQLADNWD
jgi:hypothetical protein